MQTAVISVSPDDPLLVVQRLFFEEEIHGAPVVDRGGRVLGMISSTDVLRAVAEEHEAARDLPAYFRDFVELSGRDWALAPQDFEARLSECVASEFMTRGVICVAPDTPVP